MAPEDLRATRLAKARRSWGDAKERLGFARGRVVGICEAFFVSFAVAAGMAARGDIPATSTGWVVLALTTLTTVAAWIWIRRV